VVHGLYHEWIASGPVKTVAGQQPNAGRIGSGHEPEAVVLDFVNPVGAKRGACRRETGGRAQ
jgi:hypothetical protein